MSGVWACSKYRAQGCGAAIPVRMVTATDTKPGGFHETGTSTPKLAFSECYTDENRRKVKLVHTHVWQMNLTHTWLPCVE